MGGERHSLEHFRKWMQGQKTEQHSLGRVQEGGDAQFSVMAKYPPRRTASKMSMESGDVEVVALEFCRDGGDVVGVDGKTLLVETPSGSFLIHRSHVLRTT